MGRPKFSPEHAYLFTNRWLPGGEIRVPDPMPGALTNQVGEKISPHSAASAATGGHGV